MWRASASWPCSAIQDIQARGKTPLIVGGSGMYMSVLLDGIFEGTPADEDIRAELTQELQVQGPAFLHERLKGLDPQAAAKIHPNDPQRIIRALEVVLSTGQPISQLATQARRAVGENADQILPLIGRARNFTNG